MHRFFIPKTAIQDESVELPPSVAHQVRSVLRMKPGELIAVLDGSGWEYEVELTALTTSEVKGRVVGWKEVLNEPKVWVTVYQSLLKKDNFELILEKGTELGVSAFVPLETSRTIVKIKEEREDKKLKRWERIMKEAVEQSGRGRIPEIYAPMKPDEMLEQIGGYELTLIFSTGEGGYSLRQVFNSLGYMPLSVAVMIGPEGGFTPEEVDKALQAGATLVSMGPRVLRAETAAIVSTGLVMEYCGQLGDVTAPPPPPVAPDQWVDE